MCLGELAEVIEMGTQNALVSGGERTRTVSLLTLTDPVLPATGSSSTPVSHSPG